MILVSSSGLVVLVLPKISQFLVYYIPEWGVDWVRCCYTIKGFFRGYVPKHKW